MVQTVRALAAKTDNLTLRTHIVEDPSPKCCPLTSTHMVGHKNKYMSKKAMAQKFLKCQTVLAGLPVNR